MNEKLKNKDKVFFTWDIHYACNYRCIYCFFHGNWKEEAKKNRYPGIEKWKKIWDDIYERYGEAHIHISGGEPFTYPGFIDLIIHLIKKFTVEFDTNLTFNVDDFISKVGPERVKFATAFHPRFADFPKYLNKITKLKKAGYDIGVNYVAYPPQIDEIKRYKEKINAEHITLSIMPFDGEYNKKRYPEGYSSRERSKLKKIDPETAARILGDSTDSPGCGEEKPLNPHLGKKCAMGHRYAKIHPNGNAYRCCLVKDKGFLGNLIDGTFNLYDTPKTCDLDKCPCWVAMVIGEEENWGFHWVTPHSFKQDV